MKDGQHKTCVFLWVLFFTLIVSSAIFFGKEAMGVVFIAWVSLSAVNSAYKLDLIGLLALSALYGFVLWVIGTNFGVKGSCIFSFFVLFMACWKLDLTEKLSRTRRHNKDAYWRWQ